LASIKDRGGKGTAAAGTLAIHITKIFLADSYINSWCWGLVLKCYELRTRQHKMLNIDALRPLKHYLPKDLMNFGRRP
jgi:hypothetical protein